jgi:hypothetical protein
LAISREHYHRKRQDTVIIGSDIRKASPYAFCKSMKSATTQQDFDLFLTDIGEGYVVAVDAGLMRLVARLMDVWASVIAHISAVSERRADYSNARIISEFKILADTAKSIVLYFVSYGSCGAEYNLSLALPQPLYVTKTLLTWNVEIFILGHEFGHIVEGHLDHCPS